jgi:hypothetical protein
MAGVQTTVDEPRVGDESRAVSARRSRELGAHARSSVVIGSIWMVGLSLVLFFVPLINGVVGGLVGGYKVGSVGRALLAAIIPAIAVAIGLWLILALLDAPVIGFFAGAAAGVLILLADVGLFIGAAIGGAMSPKR